MAWGAPQAIRPFAEDSPFTTPWGVVYPNIPSDAMWIWHESGAYYDCSLPSPLCGYDHDEFLVFSQLCKWCRTLGEQLPA